MSIRAVNESQTGPNGTGIIAKPVAQVVSHVDQWDVLLILGVAMLIAGAWLQWGLPVGLLVGGLLFALGGLWGARNSSEVVET